ncbi:hypothetical protein CLU96_1898 [Chryseobacterium sp. 52]|uniref:hypothetical protein n=1 Tax=Chryseobacterium sp. 52 TaxID=2035213 RepID=UPI000C18DB1E|nr:hypothetical protein [Chryseobacterium sp. 52]PIF44901.1 hypothetical protein CLU96_1898 [Chryseobacterium sp. 52]
MRKIKDLIKQLVRWALRSEINRLNDQLHKNEIKFGTLTEQLHLNELQYKFIKDLLKNLDVSVDYHYKYSKSWAVISLQGNRSDFIKFIDLGDRDIYEIQRFLRQFDRTKVDAAPAESAFLRINPKNRKF